MTDLVKELLQVSDAIENCYTEVDDGAVCLAAASHIEKLEARMGKKKKKHNALDRIGVVNGRWLQLATYEADLPVERTDYTYMLISKIVSIEVDDCCVIVHADSNFASDVAFDSNKQAIEAADMLIGAIDRERESYD
jgi:hypothetical protein